jgi:DTW domain-containing protein YfiP
MSKRDNDDDADDGSSSSSSSFELPDLTALPPSERQYACADVRMQRFQRRVARGEQCERCWLKKPDECCACEAMLRHRFSTQQCNVVTWMHSSEAGRQTNSTRAFIVPSASRVIFESRNGDDELRDLVESCGTSIALLFPSAHSISVPEFVARCGDARPTFLLVDATWRQAVKVVRRLSKRLVGVAHVHLNLPTDSNVRADFRAPLWKSPSENGGYSFNPMRRQNAVGRLTSAECIWFLLSEVGEDEERVLKPALEALRIRIAFALQAFDSLLARLDRETIAYLREIYAREKK